jgi:PAS domain S-box-containing protein
MRFLRSIPIKRKLTIITMVTSGVALILACAAFVAYEQATFKRKMVRDLGIAAEMTGAHSAAALTFNDPSSAEQTLRSLDRQPYIRAACIYDKEGRVFAKYAAADFKKPFSPPALEANGFRFTDKQLLLFRRLDLKGQPIGAVFIQSDLREMQERVEGYVIIVAFVLVASTLVAFLLSSQLQRVISEPILGLARVAHQVAVKRDYSVRASKQSDDELGQLIDGFNEMLNQIQERDSGLQAAREGLEKRVQERTGELANSLSLLNATLDSTTDGIMALRLSGKVLCYNSKFALMWKFPSDGLARGDSLEVDSLSSSLASDPKRFTARFREVLASPETEAFDLIELKDGRTFERYVKPQRMEGKVVGVVINCRDITERKQAEAKLEAAHKDLLNSSRQSGMAEVATGVLHNVGNVLNSVNVSSTLICDRVRQSKISKLDDLASLLIERADDLPRFLTNDDRGKLLPSYAANLAAHLKEEQTDLLDELELLTKNIEHIKEIVAMQQSYAKVSGIIESLPVSNLVEDALQLNAAAFARHGVQILREYEDVPVIAVDKHKVLQILVNLMRNAKYALDAGASQDKRLVLGITRNGNDRVKIRVQDNGIGIAPANLTRIFSHGFTTKKDGHGFGLHSGALSAKEMGGALLAQSDGLGQGATFILELPTIKERDSL